MKSEHQSQSELVAAGYDRGAAAYAKSWSGPHPWMEQARTEFRARIKPKMRLLDIGCGPGHDSNYWATAGLKTLGIDISTKSIDAARSLYPTLDFRVMDALDLPKLDAKFDAVWMAYSLLHIAKAIAPNLIASIAVVLEINGLLFVETSLAASSQECVRSIAGLQDDTGHEIKVPYTLWAESDLTALFSKRFKSEWSKIYKPLPGRPKIWSAIMRRI